MRKSPNLREPIAATLTKLAEYPFQPSLSTHKLKGDLADRWACSVNYSDRIVFRFVKNAESGQEEILLLAIGSHDEVY